MLTDQLFSLHALVYLKSIFNASFAHECMYRKIKDNTTKSCEMRWVQILELTATICQGVVLCGSIGRLISGRI